MKPLWFPKCKRGRYQHGPYHPSGGESDGCQKPTSDSPDHHQARMSHVPFSESEHKKSPFFSLMGCHYRRLVTFSLASLLCAFKGDINRFLNVYKIYLIAFIEVDNSKQ